MGEQIGTEVFYRFHGDDGLKAQISNFNVFLKVGCVKDD